MRTRRIVTLCTLAVIAVVSLAVAGNRRFEKKFQVSPGGTLTVKTDVGSVHVVGSSANEVSVVVEMTGRQKDIDDFEITAEQTSGGVDVHGKSYHGGWSLFRSNDIDARYTVSIPHAYQVRLATSGGDLEISEVQGSVEGKTSGGDMRGANLEGAVDLATSGGTIRLESVKGEVKAQTSGGDVYVKGVTGNVEAGTSGGNVSVADVDGKVHAETSGGNVVVKVRGECKGVHAETSGGNVEVYVAKGTAANIDASTSGGDVVCDLPVTVSGKIKDSSVKGTVNGGGPLIFAHTSGGNVRIHPLE
jgi:hypothetical protein